MWVEVYTQLLSTQASLQLCLQWIISYGNPRLQYHNDLLCFCEFWYCYLMEERFHLPECHEGRFVLERRGLVAYEVCHRFAMQQFTLTCESRKKCGSYIKDSVHIQRPFHLTSNIGDQWLTMQSAAHLSATTYGRVHSKTNICTRQLPIFPIVSTILSVVSGKSFNHCMVPNHLVYYSPHSPKSKAKCPWILLYCWYITEWIQCNTDTRGSKYLFNVKVRLLLQTITA